MVLPFPSPGDLPGPGIKPESLDVHGTLAVVKCDLVTLGSPWDLFRSPQGQPYFHHSEHDFIMEFLSIGLAIDLADLTLFS